MSSAAVRAQSQDSRDEILKAAMRLFASRGFHETSMSEIAREARVSKALIFWHFKTKEELFLAVLNRLLEPYYIDFAEEAQQLNERDQIQKLLEYYLLFVRDNANSVRFFLTRMMHDEEMPDAFTGQIRRLYDGYRGMLEELLRRAQERGFCPGGFDPEKTARFLLSTLNGFLIDYLFLRSADFDSESALGMIRMLLFPGFTGDGSGSQAAS